jgi:CRISPR-associated protein Csd1
MILQALYDYYQRKQGELPPYGFQIKKIPFLIVLLPDGRFHSMFDTREPDEKKRLEATSFKVPKERERTGSNAWQRPNILWDHFGFVLGHSATEIQNDMQKAKKQFGSFQRLVAELSDLFPDDLDLVAIRSFYEKEEYERVFNDHLWVECKRIKGCNLTFKIVGNEEPITVNRNVLDFAAKNYEKEAPEDEESATASDDQVSALCLVSGDFLAIARTHPRTPIRNSKTNAKLVSFQKHMGFDSYGREQGSNAPISIRATFAYGTALNHLLNSKQQLQVGDASTVFWAERANPMESLLAQLFGEPQEDNPDEGANAVRALFEAPKTGASAIDDDGTRFFVLGLAPNAARIAVRFWHVATVAELAGNIRQHFRDLEIIRPKDAETPFLSLKALLSSLSPATSERPNGDIDKLPPNLAGDVMKATLSGAPYPRTLLQAALRRIRAEQAKRDSKTGRHRDHVPHARAALVKAWLNRHTRYANPSHEREIEMALDEQNTNIGYRLGRLFAVLERVQQDAAGGPGKVNTTIRDSYFGSASSTPSAVFPTLMRRNQHHMTKLRKEKPGLYVNRDKLIQSICNEGIDGDLGFHATLSLENQGRFVIGYYHQRQDLFKTAS